MDIYTETIDSRALPDQQEDETYSLYDQLSICIDAGVLTGRDLMLARVLHKRLSLFFKQDSKK